MTTALVALVRKDLQLFLSDRRSVIMSFVVPIAIASFFGSIFSGPSNNREPARVAVVMVDLDGSPVSQAIVAGTETDKNLRVTVAGDAPARESVRTGKVAVGVIIPKGFGEASGAAFFGTGPKPTLDMVYDPSRATELAMVRGVMTEHIMAAVSQAMFGGEQGRRLVDQTLAQIDSVQMAGDQKARLTAMLRSVQSFYNQTPSGAEAAAGTAPAGTQAPRLAMPYTVHEQAMTSGAEVVYNGYAHSFAGMGIQFLLFAAANLGIDVLIERQRGLWKRVRSAPLSRSTLLVAKVVSMTVVALMTLLVSFGFAMVVFHVSIDGSVPGFLLVAIACSVMAATFGLLVAALGRTPATARGVTTLAVLMMVMLGGAWVPSFIFPAWLQQVTLAVPARWAVDGLDAMTWRGLGLGSALTPALVLAGFAVVFGSIAFWRFPWDEA